MRTNYVLIDFENVQPRALESLAHEHIRVLIFVGANQTRLPVETAASVQTLGTRAEYVQISGNGTNALDFHIAYYIGQLAAADPAGYFHIVSKDKGFDPLIQHLRTRKIFAARAVSLAELPVVQSANAVTPAARAELAMTRLRKLDASRPRTVKTLGTTIASLFQPRLTPDEVPAIIQELAAKGHITVDGTKIAYPVANHA